MAGKCSIRNAVTHAAASTRRFAHPPGLTPQGVKGDGRTSPYADALRNVADGASPYKTLYSTANRPKFQNPNLAASSVTLVVAAALEQCLPGQFHASEQKISLGPHP
jgi:hypothetical protein